MYTILIHVLAIIFVGKRCFPLLDDKATYRILKHVDLFDRQTARLHEESMKEVRFHLHSDYDEDEVI
jgi:hypothetical protein